jgi:hypothetical protein
MPLKPQLTPSKPFRPLVETRNSKLETISNFQNPKIKTLRSNNQVCPVLSIYYLYLFRISNFGFRILLFPSLMLLKGTFYVPLRITFFHRMALVVDFFAFA